MNRQNQLISIIISTKNKEPTVLKKTLDSIFSSLYPNCEVIIIDQNRHSKIKNLISIYKSSCPSVKLLYHQQAATGLSRGRNLGLKQAKGSWVLFFDDDAILPKHFFSKIENTLEKEKNEEIIFYGKVLNIEDKSSYLKRKIRTKYLHLWNFDSVCSIGLIFNRKVLEKIGSFDENFGVGSKFPAGEEADMLIRSIRNGCKIKYLKDFVVYHPKDKINLGKKYSYGYGLGALYRKHLADSFLSLLILGAKFATEIIGRFSLFIFLFPLKPKEAIMHFYYLRGYVKGFITYSKKNNENDN